MQNWENLGCILNCNNAPSWMKSHVAVPVAQFMSKKELRLYFCSRDELNRSRIGFAEINMRNPTQITTITQKPILNFGELGTFDDSGVTPTEVINVNNKTYLYYVGWNKSQTVRFQVAVGLAVQEKNGIFNRVSQAPLFDRIKADPYLTATLSILKLKDGSYAMWYISGDGWFNKGNETFPLYNVKYATSKDGLNWIRKGIIAIDYKSDNEHAIAKPSVIYDDGIFKMWYSFKSHNYRDYEIGYAESADGLNWVRYDEKVKFDKSFSGFDDEMRAYPEIVVWNDQKFMFYNGNGYGKTGVGIARLTT